MKLHISGKEWILAMGVLIPLSWTSVEAATINVACPGQTIQAAVDSALPGDIINVTGTCTENILIRNEKQRITLDGGGTAIVNGPNSSNPTFNVRGKGILIQNFEIIGGNNGVHVNRGSNAVIHNNNIHNTGNRGINVNQFAFAIITNNNIHDNPGDGIFVSETSDARIGFNSAQDSAPSPNTIQNNGGRGILVSGTANARIIGNTISGNIDDGVGIVRHSHADVSGNTINSNGGDGVFVSGNSGVNLGDDIVVDFFDQPNSTTVNNTGFGLRCTLGAYVDGVLGTLNGTSGPSSLGANCPNGL